MAPRKYTFPIPTSAERAQATELRISEFNMTEMNHFDEYTSLTRLDINHYEGITAIPENLPPTLKQIFCYNKYISTLPSLPAGLSRLYCENATFKNLPPLPAGLNSLELGNTKISELPNLPAGLKKLELLNTKITELPSVLPHKLTILDISKTKIKVIPEPLPKSLTTLICANCGLKALPDLHEGLLQVECQENKIKYLPLLPMSLQTFNAEDNPIQDPLWGKYGRDFKEFRRHQHRNPNFKATPPQEPQEPQARKTPPQPRHQQPTEPEVPCNKVMCNAGVYTTAEWRQAVLAKKKELVQRGVTAFESDPEYKRLVQCKSDTYYTQDVCNFMYKKPANAQPPPPKQKTPPKPRCPPGSRRNKKTGECDKTRVPTPPAARVPTPPAARVPTPPAARVPTPPAARVPTPPAAAPLKRCPPGSRRNKKTGECDKTRKATPTTPSPPTPRNQTKRCPTGTRRNKKTGNCEDK